ncbi:MAG: DUF2185 domain-containing protein [Clostridia bacterium]|nr:DUF2185 domain-containing protein [Clostridia bacterium]
MGLFGMFQKKDKFLKVEFQKLIEWDEPNGEGCFASDRITKEGFKVGYMYREEPDEGKPDSGWRFLAGDEEDAYINNPKHVHLFSLNTICNYDQDIIPYLKSEIGSAYIRTGSNHFEVDDGTKEIVIEKQNR